MRTRWLGADPGSIIEHATCASTNDLAAQLARDGAPHGTVVTALAQTAGRGREGRRWISRPGAGLYVSAIVRPELPLADIPPLTLAVGIGACDAARALGAAAELKWPNDLLVGRDKLGGILVETFSHGNHVDVAIVGIGMNLEAMPPELRAELAATSIADASGAPAPARERALAELLAHVEHWIEVYREQRLPAIVPAWEARMAHGLRARATVAGAVVEGTMTGLDFDGAIRLTDPAGAVHRVRSGDVQLAHRR